MKSTAVWIIVVILILALFFFLPGILRLTGLGGYGDMMGGRGMMGGGFGYFFPFGFIGMGLMALLPAAFLVLLVVGGVALVNNLTGSGRSVRPAVPITGRTCPSCGKSAQADWNTCPYCSAPLS